VTACYSSQLLLHVQRPETSLVSEYHRVIWCPYIPDDADDSSATDSSNTDNASRMLVLTNDEQVLLLWKFDNKHSNKMLEMTSDSPTNVGKHIIMSNISKGPTYGLIRCQFYLNYVYDIMRIKQI